MSKAATSRSSIVGPRAQYARLPELAARSGSPPGVGDRRDRGSADGPGCEERDFDGTDSFIAGPDPVGDGLVTSLGRPGGNLTGVAVYTSDLMPKRLQMLGQLVPRAATVALLVNPTGFAADHEAKLIETAMQATGQRLFVLNANHASSDFEPRVRRPSSSGRTRSSCTPIHFSMPGALSLSRLRHAMPYPRAIPGANMPTPAA